MLFSLWNFNNSSIFVWLIISVSNKSNKKQTLPHLPNDDLSHSWSSRNICVIFPPSVLVSVSFFPPIYSCTSLTQFCITVALLQTVNWLPTGFSHSKKYVGKRDNTSLLPSCIIFCTSFCSSLAIASARQSFPDSLVIWPQEFCLSILSF